MEPRTVLFLCSGNYYRSRFAELLFNHLVAVEGRYRADSAGLWPNCRSANFGAISPDTIAALRARGVSLPASHRIPRDVTERDLSSAALTIALKEAEHRPLLARHFPSFVERVEYWHVHDVDDAPPSEAIPLIEVHVRELVARLKNEVPALP
jgi:protein-tyrosine phosphatase